MAVIVKYVVVHDGKEDMIFTTKKEAEAYDKILDIAEQLHEFLQTAAVDIAEDTLDELAFFMAQHREPIGRLLKGSTLDAPVGPEASSAPGFAKKRTKEPTVVGSKTRDALKRARASKPKAVA